MNIAQHVVECASRYPEHPALLFEGRSFTYGQLSVLSAALSARLTIVGVHSGDRVALLLPNVPEFVIAYLAVQRLGAIAVSIDPTLRGQEVRFILEDCDAQVVLTNATCRMALPANESLSVLSLSIDQLSDNVGVPNDMAVAELRPADPCAILYTSGTTGLPKGVTLTHSNVLTNATAKARYCGTQPQDRLLLMVPLSHCFGQNAIMNHAFQARATIILLRTFKPSTMLAAVEEDKVTMFFSVPMVYALLLSLGDLSNALRTVRYFFSGAAPLDVEVSRRWLELHGRAIHQGYGLTECSPFASYNGSPLEHPESIGVPIEGVEMRVVDENGSTVMPGEVGEILIRGPNVMKGYWNRPVDTAEAIRDGWLHTGDLGWCSSDGWFHLVDRKKDMINVAGLKVYPAEVERALGEHPAVSEAAVFGIPDSVLGERVRCQVVLRDSERATPTELLAFCRDHVAPHKVPESIVICEHLPRNAAGKLLRRMLRARD